MGHVDHGKTTLLDYIRKTTVASREAGGITQSIGAYEIIHRPDESRTDADGTQTNAEITQKDAETIPHESQTDVDNLPRKSASGLRKSALSRRGSAKSDFATDRKITFIDTPGHEAFSKMRARGAKVADLAILVVAADEGIKPQTKDALQYILGEKLNFIVAINKIDKPGADIEKIKQELAQAQVFLEGFGGDVSWHAISAKTGEGMDGLLDLILLAADIQGLTYDPEASPSGIVLSTHLDARRGLAVDVIVKDGTLWVGDTIYTPSAKAKIRSMANYAKKSIKEAAPSQPVEILGFLDPPLVGEEFSKDKSAHESAGVKIRGVRAKNGETESAKIILKADESGSLEALEHVALKVGKTRPLTVIEKGIGDIYETDIKLAGSSKAIILGFKVRVDKAADTLVKTQKIKIIASDIIYELEESLLKFLEEQVDLLKRAIEILAIFGVKDGRQIIGGRVMAGTIKNQESFKVLRGEEVVGEGKIMNLQSGRKDVAEVPEGIEVGVLVECPIQIAKGDKLSFVQ